MTIALAYRYLGAVTAIKGTYTIVGVLLAAAVFRTGSENRHSQTALQNPISRQAMKAVIILVLLAYVVTYVTNQRMWVTIVVLMLGWMLIGVQIVGFGATKSVVPQIATLFTVSPVTKYLSTGFYYGETDIFGHVRAIELVNQSGGISLIAEAYGTYDLFPGMHIISSSISSVTGLLPYDSLLILGIITYSAVVLIVFYTCSVFLTGPQSVAVTLVFASLNTVHYFTNYFFPQAFATALLFYLIYVTTRRRSVAGDSEGRLSIASVVFIGALVLAHHITQIVFIVVFTVIYLPSLIRGTSLGQRLSVNQSVPRVTPMLLALTAGVTYLILSSTAVVAYFFDFTTELLESPFVSDAGGARVVFGFGTGIPYHTPRDALISVFYVDGVYNIGVLALFVAGIATILYRYRSYTHIAGFLLLGVLGSLAVLRTPFLSSLSRLSLPLSFFFSLVAGIGLWQLIAHSSSRSVDVSTSRVSIRGAVVFTLIMMVGVTGPLVAADDLYGLHSGPNLWETYSTAEQQVEFSDRELEEFESTVGYIDEHDSDVSMLWVSQEASSRFSGEERPSPASISADGIEAEGSFVYRTKWAEHQVGYSTDTLGTLVIADWWLNKQIRTNNKVYSTGGVGILWGEGLNLSNETP